MAVTLSVNQWNGQTTLQLMMVDARVDGVQLFNIRSKSVELPAGVPILDFTSDLPEILSSPAIVVKNIPEDLSLLKQVLQEQDFSAIYFKNDISKAYYLTGYGTREQFAKLYKTTISSQNLIFVINSRTYQPISKLSKSYSSR